MAQRNDPSYMFTTRQMVGESKSYSIDLVNVTATPTAAAAFAYDVTGERKGVIVTSTILSGSASIASTTLTTPLVQSLTLGHTYEIHIKFTTDGTQVEKRYFVIEAIGEAAES